jgi:hypothetical protein
MWKSVCDTTTTTKNACPHQQIETISHSQPKLPMPILDQASNPVKLSTKPNTPMALRTPLPQQPSTRASNTSDTHFYPADNFSMQHWPPSTRSPLTVPSQWSNPSPWSLPPLSHSTATAESNDNAPYHNTRSRPKSHVDPTPAIHLCLKRGEGIMMKI